MAWDLAVELDRIKGMNLSYENRILAFMHAYHADMVQQARVYAEGKSEHTRIRSKAIMQRRSEGEKSGDMCGVYADSLDDVYAADCVYRLAEQMVAADKAKLQILHAELEKWRTQRADERAADAFTARTGV